jgi:hypothetical protein
MIVKWQIVPSQMQKLTFPECENWHSDVASKCYKHCLIVASEMPKIPSGEIPDFVLECQIWHLADEIFGI